MAKLTESMLQQRNRGGVNDLDRLQNVNVANRNIQDISLVKKMSNIEVLSLSLNRIKTLEDLKDCKNLEVLYLRNNEINDLNQLSYLSNLPKLKILTLTANPCTTQPLYRSTVIKNIETLQNLDNVPITTEERLEAARVGLDLVRPSSMGSNLGSSIDNFKKYENAKASFTSSTKSLSLFKEHMPQENIRSLAKDRSMPQFPKSSTPSEFIRQSSRHIEKKYTERDQYRRNVNLLTATLHLVKELSRSNLDQVYNEIAKRLNDLRSDGNCD